MVLPDTLIPGQDSVCNMAVLFHVFYLRRNMYMQTYTEQIQGSIVCLHQQHQDGNNLSTIKAF